MPRTTPQKLVILCLFAMGYLQCFGNTFSMKTSIETPSLESTDSKCLSSLFGKNLLTYSSAYSPEFTNDCDCIPSGNLVTNGNFANGLNGWTFSSETNKGSGYCNSTVGNVGYLSNGNGAEAVASQTITSGVAAGQKYTISFSSGTHNPSGNTRVRIKFLKSNGSEISTPLNVEINHDVDNNPHNDWCRNLKAYGPYTYTAPALTAKIKIEFVEVSTNNSYIKFSNVVITKCETQANGKVGNFVWEDTDKDGVQDSGEPGINGVSVKLYKTSNNSLVASTTTANSSGNPGYYSFETCPGQYYIVFGDYGDYDRSPNSGAITTTNNSDANPTTGKTANFNITSGGNITYVDAGYWKEEVPTGPCGCVASSNLVKNGSFNSGLNDWTIESANSSGVDECSTGNKLAYFSNGDAIPAVLHQTITSNITPGVVYTYSFSSGTHNKNDSHKAKLSFLNSSGQVISTPLNMEIDHNVDNNPYSEWCKNLKDFGPFEYTAPAGAAKVKIEFTEISANKSFVKVDNVSLTYCAGPTTGKVSNFVWEDKNANGTQDGGEPGLNGVKVQLYKSNDILVETTYSAGGGFYQFEVCPGTYYIKFGGFENYKRTPKNGGITTATNSDADVTTGKTATFTINSGDDLTYVDAGYFLPASIGDIAWLDENADGLQNDDETGIGGIEVTLLDNSNNPVTTDADGNAITPIITPASGFYEFTNLKPGTYKVKFGSFNDFIRSPKDAGADGIDSDPSTTTGITGSYTLVSGESNNTVDAGYFQLAQIGDTIWLDANKNGIQDAGEFGLPGMTAQLLNGSGQPVTTDGLGNPISIAITDENGYYMFTNLLPGNYKIKFGSAPGYSLTSMSMTDDDDKDSDANPITGITETYTLAPGEHNMSVDAGFVTLSNLLLCGEVFYDFNGLADGIVNGSKFIPPGLKAVLVKVYPDNSQEIVEVATVPAMGQSGEGLYNFTGESNTRYYVMLSTQNLSVGATPPTNASLPNSYFSTGENIGSGPGNDGLVNGKSAIFETQTSGICEINFGIRRFTAITID